MKYLDWLPITKEERTKAAKLESDGIWAAKSLPPKDTPVPASPSTIVTRKSVNYTVAEATKSPTGDGTSGAGNGTTEVAAGTPVAALRAQAVSTPSPVLRRNAAPYRESSQFNGDFSALGSLHPHLSPFNY